MEKTSSRRRNFGSFSNLQQRTSLLTKFRGRLGDKGYKRLFDQLIAATRLAVLVRNLGRHKGATDVIVFTPSLNASNR